MKGKITLLFIIALVVGGMVGFAGDGNDDKRHRHNRCNPAGTWYSEVPADAFAPAYVATITPIQGHSRYSVVYQGLYYASDLPWFTFTVMTNWSGELVKSGDGYDTAIIAILGERESFPYRPFETWGVKGHMTFSDDCNTMEAASTAVGWWWGENAPTPWVDTPDYLPFGPDTMYETYHRMIMPTN